MPTDKQQRLLMLSTGNAVEYVDRFVVQSALSISESIGTIDAGYTADFLHAQRQGGLRQTFRTHWI